MKPHIRVYAVFRYVGPSLEENTGLEDKVFKHLDEDDEVDKKPEERGTERNGRRELSVSDGQRVSLNWDLILKSRS